MENFGKEESQKMLTMVEPFMMLEEKLTTCFDNPVYKEPHSGHLYGEESHRCQDDFDQNM